MSETTAEQTTSPSPPPLTDQQRAVLMDETARMQTLYLDARIVTRMSSIFT
jgi:hypothetical protein